MFGNSLDSKPIVTRDDKTQIKDLTATMFDLATMNYVKYNVYRVPAEFAMRPDLIAGAVYNNSKYAEIILKFNGISNPFSIQGDDIILIPNLDSAQKLVKNTQKGTAADSGKAIRDSYKYIDPTKIPKRDSTFDNRQIVGGAKQGALPPNISPEGQDQITYRNGRVYFGAGVDTCLQNGMTQSEFLTNIIKSKKV